MTAPTQKPAPTVADYKAAEERLRQVRDEAAAGVRDAQVRGDLAVGTEWASRLKKEFDDFRAFREGIPPAIRLSINADRILESFSVDKDNFVHLVIPSDISDEDAMHALNARFRGLFPDKERDAIYTSHMARILDAGGESGRSARSTRTISLIGVVPGTKSKTRDQQAEVLKQKGLTFAHPIEQALAAAAYACRCKGEDLLKSPARGSVPKVTLGTSSFGVCVNGYFDEIPYQYVTASGSPSPELKNLDR